MSNTLIIILLILYTIWCYNHKNNSLKDLDDNLINIYKVPKPPHEKHPKPMPPNHHDKKNAPYNKIIKHDHIEPSDYFPPPGKLRSNRNLIIYFSILILGSVVISFFSVPLATIFVFTMTIIIIFFGPRELNEAYPSTIGAIMILFMGVVTYPNLIDISHKIGGASTTIIATIVMTVVLESFGFFHWMAAKLSNLSKGSGYLLFWYIQLLCFIMTLLFNNDGSILITTPILILLLKNLNLNTSEQIPYLLSGALIATGSSTPIGVSNITNLIALNIIHMSLYEHAKVMFIPGTLGLLFMSFLMFLLLKKRLPPTLSKSASEIDEIFFTKKFHPFKTGVSFNTKKGRTSFMLKLLAFIFVIRCLLFTASYFSLPIEIVAVIGSLSLLLLRWYYLRTNPLDILNKTPWHILLFAFSMYVIIYGLNNIGLTKQLVYMLEPITKQSLFHASFIMGGLTSILSNIFNNHPALMINTIALSEMNLDTTTIKVIYLSNIIGSDIGALLLPVGTLASLMWMHILKKNGINVSWQKYLRLTIIVIPLTVIFTLFILYYWIQIIFI